MLRISAGVASLAAQRAIHQTERDVGAALKELATGSRFSSPGADPAGMAIAEGLNAQTKGYQAATRNAENATSFVAVGEGALSEQNNILIRLRELGVQAASDTIGDTERGFLNDEFTQLSEEFDRIAKSTTYGKQPLLNGTSKSYEFQVGLHKGADNVIKFTNDTDTTASNLDLEGLAIDDKDDARDALETIDEAMTKVGGNRAKLGAIQSRLDTSISHLQTQTEGTAQAFSRMADTDVADAVSRAKRGQILAQYQAAALADSNEMQRNYLRLVG